MNWFSSIEMSTESPAHNRFGSKYAENGRINDQKKVPDKAATGRTAASRTPAGNLIISMATVFLKRL